MHRFKASLKPAAFWSGDWIGSDPTTKFDACRATKGLLAALGFTLKLRASQKAVVHEVCVRVVSRGCSRWVNSGRGGGVSGARRIEGGEGTARGPQEAVVLVVCKIVSRDHPRRVDGVREDAQGGEGSRGIEGDDVTVGCPQEAVNRAGVKVRKIPSRDCSRRVDGLNLGEL
jgi:hypothetical protein